MGTTAGLVKTGLLVTFLSCIAVAQESTGLGVPPLQTITQEMEKAQSQVHSLAPYEIVREYQLFGPMNTAADSDVIVEVKFRPPSSKDYDIQRSSGSRRGVKIVASILDREMRVSKDRQSQSSAISSDNYDFTYLGETIADGCSCYRLGLRPKRKETDLIAGEAWIDKHSFLVRHVEGEVAKTPSWWLKNVRVKLSFAEIEGTWLQTDVEARAEVRFFGQHTLTSRTLDYRGPSVVASASPAPAVRSRRHVGTRGRAAWQPERNSALEQGLFGVIMLLDERRAAQ